MMRARCVLMHEFVVLDRMAQRLARKDRICGQSRRRQESSASGLWAAVAAEPTLPGDKVLGRFGFPEQPSLCSRSQMRN